MFDFDHDTEIGHDAPASSVELLAEVGLDPRAIAEVLARPEGE